MAFKSLQEESGGGFITEKKKETKREEDEGIDIFQDFESVAEEEEGNKPQQQKQGGGLLKAIGETIVEIGKTATDLIAGRGHGHVESGGMVKKEDQ